MKTKLVDKKVDIKVVVFGLWVSLMILYIYNDFFHLFVPDSIEHIMNGQVGVFEVTPLTMVVVTIMMVIPIITGLLTLILSAHISRILNIVVASIYTVINIGNVPGEWFFYVLSGIIQTLITLYIVYLCIKWPRTE